MPLNLSAAVTRKLRITFAVTIVVASLAGCGGVKGSGNLKSEPRQVAEFHGVESRGIFEVTVKQGAPQSVTVEADDNLLPLLTTEVQSGVLVLDLKSTISTNNPMKVEVTAPTFDQLSVSGTGSLATQGELDTKELMLSVGGTGHLKAEGKFENLRCDLGGTGRLQVAGVTDNGSFVVGGTGSLDASKLQTTGQCEVLLGGAGNVDVWADGPLKITIAGTGTVTHRGKTQNPQTQITGTGQVVKGK